MGKLREMWNNTRAQLGIFPQGSYSKNVSTSQFKEFTFDDKPLMKQFGSIKKTVYSVMNTESFLNEVTIVLNNEVVKSIVGAGDISESSFFSNYINQGINLKTDYVFRLYKDDGLNTYPLFTGIVLDIKQKKTSVQLTLGSRVSRLEKMDGLETKSNLAGWLENTQFNDSLKAILDGTGVEYEGDINDIDYLESVNEGSIDLHPFDGSTGAFGYSDDEIIISDISDADSTEYGTKYNFIADTIENFGLDDILHFSFKANDNNTYFVVEKKADASKRVGQYAQLHLVDENTPTSYIVSWYGRAPENLEFRANDFNKVSTLENAYVKDLNVDSYPDVTLEFFNGNYHYLDNIGNGDTFEGFLGQVVSQDGYFIPLFNLSKDYPLVSHEQQANQLPIVYKSGRQLTGDEFGIELGADLNTNYYDEYKGFTDNRSRKKINKSIKSRAYFVYNSANNRLIFQRASDSAPNSTGYNIDAPLFKSWNNFGLNPIGYYSFNSSNLGYIDKYNDDYIFDWVSESSSVYATILKPYFMDYSNVAGAETCKVSKIASTGVKTTLASVQIVNGVFPYGLHFYDNKISFILRGSTEWYYRTTDVTTLANDLTPLGGVSTHSTVTGSEIVNGVPVLLRFRNQQLEYIDIFTQANNILYPATTLDKNNLGGYIIKAQATEDFTAKLEDNVVTFKSQVRSELLDLTKLNRLQGSLLLNNKANKFIHIDETDTLIFKNLSNVIANTTNLTNLTDIIDVNTSDFEEYGYVNVDSYHVDDTEIYKWNLTFGTYEQDILGVWNGADASFSVNIKVLDATSLQYNIISSGSLETSNTTISVSDWTNIIINKGNDFIKISFVVINSLTEEIPEPQSKYQLFFNSKALKKLEINTDVTDSSVKFGRTKNIGNRLVDHNTAKLLLNDIKSYFLGSKKIYQVELLEPLIQFNPLQLINFLYYYDKINNPDCYVRNFTIEPNGTTKIILKEK